MLFSIILVFPAFSLRRASVQLRGDFRPALIGVVGVRSEKGVAWIASLPCMSGGDSC